MKTTIELADDLVNQAKAHATMQKTTLRALVERGLRNVLDADAHAGAFRLRDASVGGTGLCAEFRGAGWQRIRETAYEGRGG